MPSASMHIVLREPVVPVGGIVRGTVVVDVFQPTRCTLLTLRCVRETIDGRGRAGKQDSTSRATLFVGGDWQVGTREYPFSMDVGGLPTYYGVDLHVVHELRATAVLPWGEDVHATRGFEVIGEAMEEPEAAPTSDASGIFAVDAIRHAMQLAAMIVLFLIPFSLGLIAIAVFEFALVGIGVIGAMILAGSVWGLVALYLDIRPRIAEQRLGDVELFAPERFRPGEAVSCRLRFEPRKAAEIRTITASLSCAQQTVTGSYKGRAQTRKDELYRDEVSVYHGGNLAPGRPFEAEFEVPAPVDAYPSFRSGPHHLDWYLDLHIDIAGYPDWTQQRRLNCVPAATPRADRRQRRRGGKLRVTVQAEQTCPYCRDGLAGEGERALMTCGGCKTVYHRECLREFDSCATRGCRNRRVRT